MRVTCQNCGGPFEAKRSNAKWCSRRCRGLGSPAKETDPDAPRVMRAANHPFVVLTRDELDRLGKTDTMLGQQVLVIADRMASGGETGSAVVSLSKEHARLMHLLSRGETADPVDEVSRKRDAKRARAAGA